MAAAVIINEFVDTQKIYKSFSDFITETNLLGMTAGIVVGIGTYNVIRSTTFDVFIPLLNWVIIGGIRFIHMKTYQTLDRVLFRGMATFNFAHCIQEIIIWLVLLFITYVVIGRIALAEKTEVRKPNTVL
jgi:large-conductance mechanosensitive channel